MTNEKLYRSVAWSSLLAGVLVLTGAGTFSLHAIAFKNSSWKEH